MPNYRI